MNQRNASNAGNPIPTDILETVRLEELGARGFENEEVGDLTGMRLDLDPSIRQSAQGQTAGYR